MNISKEKTLINLSESFKRIRGNESELPEASIIIPVNAKEDLDNVLNLLIDIAKYRGNKKVEVILVINNYTKDFPPREIELFQKANIKVVAIPNARRKGEFICVSARALGVEAATSDVTFHTDADCQIPDINKLLTWTIEQHQAGAMVSYGRVDYFGLPPKMSVLIKMIIHHTARWGKRNIFRIPTTQGANFAVNRLLWMKLYNEGKISAELQVGPAAKLIGTKVTYSGRRSMRVLASGRTVKGGWTMLFRYFRYRLKYNLKATPTKKRDVSRLSWNGFDQQTDNRMKRKIKK